MNEAVLGWDVGGANVKAARLDASASGERVAERAFPLWRQPQGLTEVLADVASSLGGPTRRMAVTMTAELADCFATRRQGVGFVIDALETAFVGTRLWIYGVDGRFRSAGAARRRPLRVAAANWMASATLVAEAWPNALFLDVGSTTSDVIPIVDGRVVAAGRTDTGRLRRGELVYTGALRTPVCAVVRALPWRGRRCRVAAELFAIAADAHRWLGSIQEGDYTCETPDGRGRSREEAGARLARMVCSDLESLDASAIAAIAECVARAQVRQIAAAIRQVMRRLGAGAPRLAVLAGRGRFLARAAAEQAGLQSCEADSLLGAGGAGAAPAVAVARLLARAARAWR
jgi:probable H4MPT-linked C1 transfer pathway protein